MKRDAPLFGFGVPALVGQRQGNTMTLEKFKLLAIAETLPAEAGTPNQPLIRSNLIGKSFGNQHSGSPERKNSTFP